MPDTAKTTQLRVYETLDPGLLKRHEASLKEVWMDALEVPRIHSDDFYFAVDDKCGWIVFKSQRYFFRDSTEYAYIPASRADALALAGEALSRLAQALTDVARYPFLAELETRGLVPQVLKNPDVVAVPHPEQPYIDHMLCRFQPYLPVDDDQGQHVPLLGAQVDLRIGHHNQVLSYVARWSPLTGRSVLRDQVPLALYEAAEAESASSDGHSHDTASTSHHDSSQPNRVLVYVQDNYHKLGLAPFYYSVEGGHHGGLLPACDHALLIGFGKSISSTIIRSAAWVLGGSGDYDFQWYGWRPDRIFTEEGVHDLGRQPSVELPIAVWNLVLVVTDRQYQVVAEHQEMVFPLTIQHQITREEHA